MIWRLRNILRDFHNVSHDAGTLGETQKFLVFLQITKYKRLGTFSRRSIVKKVKVVLTQQV